MKKSFYFRHYLLMLVVLVFAIFSTNNVAANPNDSLQIVENDVETEAIDLGTEDDNKAVEIQLIEASEEEEEDAIFQVVEIMPEFPGGQTAIFQYLSQNVKYPVFAQENGIQGRVICQFVVNKDGSIVDVEVVRSAGDASLDKEAVRVIQAMPRWTPGKQRGKPVRVKYTVPVSFKLQEATKPETKTTSL